MTAGFSTSVSNQQLTLITFSAQHVYIFNSAHDIAPFQDHVIIVYVTDWPGSSHLGFYSHAFHFHDWGRDLDMQTNDFRETLLQRDATSYTRNEESFHV